MPDLVPKRSRLRLLLFAVAAVFPLTYVVLALLRIGQPFELEWIEGGSLAMVRRILAGLPLYAAPSLGYIPFNYPPLYFVAAAALARVLGASFASLRIVSFVASLACGMGIVRLVITETRCRGAAVLAVCLFFATYRFAGAWLDTARADSLQLALLLLGFVILREDESRVRGPALAGVAIALSFMAKQTSGVAAIPVAVYLLVRQPVRGAVFAAVAAGVAGIATWTLDATSGGWFGYYVFGLAGRYGVEPMLVARFWTRDFLGPFGVAVLGGLFAAFASSVRPRGVTWAMIAGLVLSAWIVRSFPAAYDNVLLPACAAAALLLGLGWSAATRTIGALGTPAAGRLATFVTIAALLQFAPFVYDPRAQIPRVVDRASGERLLAGLRQAPGEVLVPCHDYLTQRAGKPDHFHEMAFMAVAKSGTDTTATRMLEQLRTALHERRWGTIVLDHADWLWDEVARDYEPRFWVFGADSVMWPVTGMHRRPEVIFVPKAEGSVDTTGRHESHAISRRSASSAALGSSSP